METSRFVEHVLTLYGWSSNGTRKTTFTIFIYTNILCIHTNGHKKKSTDRRKEMSQSHWGSGYYNVLTFDFHHVLIICVFFHCFDFAMLWHCLKYTSLFSRKTLDDYGGGEILSHPRWVYRRPCCRLILIFKTWKWPGPSQATKETSSGCVSVCFKVRGHSPLAHTNPNIPLVIPLIHSCV